ncbi:uncharacterized protein LOC142341503 isoform X2 [Convolutriloba macropyga]|uniref:uncharacterized protein LOC142341503 isoform X2 n=1 Tax=Convolutriloba macropyga TaxID=536237 RepID=UPI003F52087C
MQTTERYSKINAPVSNSDVSSSAAIMANSGAQLPLWKRQLLERKVVNERIMKQADAAANRRPRSDQTPSPYSNVPQTSFSVSKPSTSHSKIESPSAAGPHGFPNLANIYPKREQPADNVNVDAQSIILPSQLKQQQQQQKQMSKKQAELLSPQPYKSKLRNSIVNEAEVVEEAVVKVKENPFKYLESEKQQSPQQSTSPPHMNTFSVSANPKTTATVPFNSSIVNHNESLPVDSEPIYMNTKPASNLNNSEDSLSSSFSSEFTQVRSLFERYSSPKPPIQAIIPKPFKPSGGPKSSPQSFGRVSGSSSSDSFDNVKQPVVQSVETKHVVSNEMILPVDKDGQLDFAQNEMPAPNTVSSLKSVWETKDATKPVQRGFKIRPRDKTPPPAGFRRITSSSLNNVSNNSSKSAFSRPVHSPQPIYDNIPQPRHSRTPMERENRPHDKATGSPRSFNTSPIARPEPLVMRSEPLLFNLKTEHTANAPQIVDSNDSVSPSKHPHIDHKMTKRTELNFSRDKPTSDTKEIDNSRSVPRSSISTVKDSVCIENYVPKFVHEYTSHRVTSILNSIIRDSFNYRVIPKAITLHQPNTPIIITKPPSTLSSNNQLNSTTNRVLNTDHSTHTASIVEPDRIVEDEIEQVSRHQPKIAGNSFLPSEEPNEVSAENNTQDFLYLDNSETPEVILIEKEDEKEDQAVQQQPLEPAVEDFPAPQQVSLDTSFHSESGIPAYKSRQPKMVENDNESGANVLVFGNNPNAKSNGHSGGVMKVVPKEDQSTSDIVRIEPAGLPVVTSFKESPVDEAPLSPTDRKFPNNSTALTVNEVIARDLAMSRPLSKEQGSREELTILVEPPPGDLKSCINQKSKQSESTGKRKISFHEDVYVHEYPVVFWTSEEELRMSQMEREAQETLSRSNGISNPSSDVKDGSSSPIYATVSPTSESGQTENGTAAFSSQFPAAPLASHEDDMVSPLGSTNDVTDVDNNTHANYDHDDYLSQPTDSLLLLP